MAEERRGHAAADAFRHLALDEVTSTNEECLRLLRTGDPGHIWITARTQTGGRGRRGRRWVSEAGNLYASLLLVNPATQAHLASLPLVVALAVQRAVSRALPADAPPVQVKWPNDILVGRAKVAGILLEAESTGDGRPAVVIGIGINIARTIADAPYPTLALNDLGLGLHPEDVFAHLFLAMADCLTVWDGGRGVTEIIRRWREVACGIGEPITVNLANRSVSGLFAGIDDTGILMLDRGSMGIMPVAAGDVFFELDGPRIT